MVANRGDLLGQRWRDRDEIRQAGQSHRCAAQRKAQAGGGDSRAARPGYQKYVVTGQGQRVMAVRCLVPGLSLGVGDDGREVLAVAVRGHGDHDTGD